MSVSLSSFVTSCLSFYETAKTILMPITLSVAKFVAHSELNCCESWLYFSIQTIYCVQIRTFFEDGYCSLLPPKFDHSYHYRYSFELRILQPLTANLAIFATFEMIGDAMWHFLETTTDSNSNFKRRCLHSGCHFVDDNCLNLDIYGEIFS